MPIAGIMGGNRREDRVHSIAASVAGFALCGATVARQMDWLSGTMLATSIVVPLLMKLRPNIAGLVQRLMFGFSFVWLLDVFR